MRYTAYDNQFEQIEDAPVGSKAEVLSWMESHFPGLGERSAPQENEASIFFFDGDVSAYGTDSDGEVYLVELGDEDQDDDSGAADKSDSEETAFESEQKIGRTKCVVSMSKTEGGWSLDRMMPLPKGSVVIPSEIEGRMIVALARDLFRGAKDIVSVKMPDTIIRIPGQGFYGAFSGCSKLKKVGLSQNLKVLGSGTFGDCVALEAIELPDSIEEVGAFAFAGCTELKTVKMPKGLPKIDASLFEGCSSLVKVEFKEGLTEVCQDVFKNCASLTEVVFPSSFNPDDLWSSMFCNCPNLRRVVFRIQQPDEFDQAEFISCYFEDCPKVEVVFGRDRNAPRKPAQEASRNRIGAKR